MTLYTTARADGSTLVQTRMYAKSSGKGYAYRTIRIAKTPEQMDDVERWAREVGHELVRKNEG